MNNNSIINKIAKEVNSYENSYVYLTEKVKYSQHETIKKIITHQNNGFIKTSDKKRFFFNIGNSRKDTNVKKIDFDTKDVLLKTDENKNKKLFLEAEMKQYLKDTNQATKINDIVEEFVDFGSVVLKKDPDEGYRKINLANLKVVDQTAESLEDTTVIEEYSYNITEFRRLGNEKGWDNVEQVIEELVDENDKNPRIYVYIRYGEMSVAEFKEIKGEKPGNDDNNKYTQAITIVATDRRSTKDWYFVERGEATGNLLFCEKLEPEKHRGKTFYKPYREAHFDAYQGRWLRKGVREKLFDLQDRANILGNEIYEAMKWSSKHIFWSNDSKIAGRNILSSIQNGQIIHADNLNILNVAERNLSAQVNEWNRLMTLADRETQAFEVATGEKLPSGTTLGAVEIQTGNANLYFNYKRQRLALMFKQVFNDWLLDDIIERINKKHTLELPEDPQFYDKFYDMQSDMWLSKNYLKMSALNQRLVTREEAQRVKEIYKQSLINNPDTSIKVVKDFYKDLKARCDIVITGESYDKQTKINNGIALLGYIQDPTISQKILTEIAADLGFDISSQPVSQQGMPQQQGQQRAPSQPQNPGGQPGSANNQII